MNETEQKVDKVIQEIYGSVPMNWSANFRTSDQVVSLLEKGGLSKVSIEKEEHDIHPLAKGRRLE